MYPPIKNRRIITALCNSRKCTAMVSQTLKERRQQCRIITKFNKVDSFFTAHAAVTLHNNKIRRYNTPWRRGHESDCSLKEIPLTIYKGANLLTREKLWCWRASCTPPPQINNFHKCNTLNTQSIYNMPC